MVRFYFWVLLLLLASSGRMVYGENFQGIPDDHRRMLEERSYQVLGIGTACMDLVIPVEDEFLQHVPGKKGGAQQIDFETMQTIIAKSGTQPQIATGGSCANAIKSLAKLGESCALLGKIGQDEMGVQFAHYMYQAGVIPLFIPGQSPTARVLCLVTPDGQRTMRFFEGCSPEMTESQLHLDYFQRSALIHLEGYALRNKGLIQKSIELAKQAHVKVSLDLASFEIVQQFKKEIWELLPLVDILFGNEDEIRTLTEADSQDGCALLRKTCPLVVVLIGKEGCLVGSSEGVFHSPGFPVHAVDSTGAGDFFASGFLYGYLRGYPLATCARFGNLLGSRIVQVFGAELPESEWEEIRTILAKEEN
jgi:sugar/nucleoside kinase (ribokinase family)